MINFKNANNELKKVLRDYNDFYKSLCKKTRDEKIATLKPGAPVPAENIIYSESGKQLFDEKSREYKAKANSIIDPFIADLRTKLTDAPSTDAVNSITLLKMRDILTENDINDMIDRYGDNVQSYRAITSIAREHGIRIPDDHHVCAQLERLESLESSIDKLMTPNLSQLSDGKVAFMESSIDDVIPEG